MESKNANPSIACTVESCTHHCKGQNYCSLNEIKVGCTNARATDCASTACASFRLGG